VKEEEKEKEKKRRFVSKIFAIREAFYVPG